MEVALLDRMLLSESESESASAFALLVDVFDPIFEHAIGFHTRRTTPRLVRVRKVGARDVAGLRPAANNRKDGAVDGMKHTMVKMTEPKGKWSSTTFTADRIDYELEFGEIQKYLCLPHG